MSKQWGREGCAAYSGYFALVEKKKIISRSIHMCTQSNTIYQ